MVERGKGIIFWDKSCSNPRQVKQRYLEVGRKMKEYEDEKYEHWKETTEQNLPNLMKKSLLTKVRPSALPTERAGCRPLQGAWRGTEVPVGATLTPLSGFLLLHETSREPGEMAQLETLRPWAPLASERP